MNSHADKTPVNTSQAVADRLTRQQSNSKPTSQFVSNRPEAIAQRALQQVVNDSAQVKQLRAVQEMANNKSSVKQLSALSTGLNPVQRKIAVEADVRKKSVVITAKGVASDFQEGSSAKNVGWNGVDKYKAEAKVGKNEDIKLGETDNNYLVAQAGHVLADQNGGNGTDPDNVFAQDGGVNNGPFRKDFENPMRKQLNKADDDDRVNFRAVLYGDDITQGALSKETDLSRSEEETDFSGFDSSSDESSSEEEDKGSKRKAETKKESKATKKVKKK